MGDDLNDTREPGAARIPNLGRRVAARSAGLTGRRSASLVSGVTARRTVRTAAQIVPLTVARRPPRPVGTGPASPAPGAYPLAVSEELLSAPESSPDSEFSAFAYRWMFGDGQVEGVPFSDGAGLALLARSSAEAETGSESGRQPSAANDDNDLHGDGGTVSASGDEAPPGRALSERIPRGRVDEVPSYRLSRTPPSATPDDEPAADGSAIRPSVERVTTRGPIEEFGPAAYRGPRSAPVDEPLDAPVANVPDGEYSAATEVASTSSSRRERQALRVRSVAQDGDPRPERAAIVTHRRPEPPITFVDPPKPSTPPPAAPKAAAGGSSPKRAGGSGAASQKRAPAGSAAPRPSSKKAPTSATRAPTKGGGSKASSAPRPRGSNNKHPRGKGSS